MPYYSYSCKEHGIFDVWQSMKEIHNAICPTCKKLALRIFCPAALQGDLPYKKSYFKLAKTREDLFKHFGEEGLEDKDMYKFDKHQREERLITSQKNK